MLPAALLLWLAAAAPDPPRGILTQFERMTRQPLWPGFEPRTVPLAIYDGATTWLIRHPAPPKEFVETEPAGVRWFRGRHPEVRGNSPAPVGGALTAILYIEAGKAPSDTILARTLVHEAFHVYHQRQHPAWSANEADLFTYPAEMVDNLALANLELQVLHRALSGDTPCWGAAAVALRAERFAGLPKSAASYERLTELTEGLAQYVTGLAEGRAAPLPPRAFGAAEVRRRAYFTGEAWAWVLDRIAGGWKENVQASLDVLAPDVPGCAPTAEERSAVRAAAAQSVRQVLASRETARASFLAQPGWSVVLRAGPGAPFAVDGFDPVNIEILSASELLHKRWLKLNGPAGSVEVLDRAALSTGAGAHPVSGGVSSVIVTGLDTEPDIQQKPDRQAILTAPGLTVQVGGARVERQDRRLVITVNPPPPTGSPTR